MGDKSRGIYGKYHVSRVDGSDTAGGKHCNCDLFVLDLNHDPHARRAAIAYADSAQAGGYHSLAKDLRELVGRHREGDSSIPLDGVMRPGDCAEFLTDKQTEKGPSSGAITNVSGDSVTIRHSDNPGEEFSKQALSVNRETRHHDGIRKLWIFD